jgi:A/G-specific adenine glycosylase
VAVVDGNVERVLHRLTGRNLTVKQCWQRAEQLLSKSRPGDFNQSMMELGATVCLPREPRCLACPVRQWCVTQGEHLRLPPTGSKAPVRQKKREMWCALNRRDGHVRLVKRARNVSLMAGMWELPQWPDLPHATAEGAHWRTFRHSITVTDYRVHVLRDWTLKSSLPARGKWVAIEKIPELPLTGLTRKVLKAGGII